MQLFVQRLLLRALIHLRQLPTRLLILAACTFVVMLLVIVPGARIGGGYTSPGQLDDGFHLVAPSRGGGGKLGKGKQGKGKEADPAKDERKHLRSKMWSQAEMDAALKDMSAEGDGASGGGASSKGKGIMGRFGEKRQQCLRNWKSDGSDIKMQRNFPGNPDSNWVYKVSPPLPRNSPLRGQADVPRSRKTAAGLQYMHMAMVERLPNGTVVAAWQAAEVIEGAEDQHIWFSFSKDLEGKSWSPPRMVPVPAAGALWSPILHAEPSGRLRLFYCESRDCIRPATGKMPARWVPGGDIKATSTMTGERWSPPRLILSQDDDGGIPKVLANKPTVLRNGAWLLPFWRETPRNARGTEKGKCSNMAMMKGSAGALVSPDKGARWVVFGQVTHPLTWLIENSVVELRDGSLNMFFRTWAGQVFYSKSVDQGRTWNTPGPTGLPNPDSKTHVIRLRGSNDLAIAFNDHQKYHEDGFTRFRTRLRVAISRDDGKTWHRVAQVDDEVTPGWQFHYPTLLQVGCKLLVA
eukprot:CAMPEP_0182893546 /NCGR_PEP_ID=MMETSP0034_2-20130328/24539_1 /TAXON_ID=156128 /ORGANISM="Nephroselmis pyriformis, Strain CCMP717" /LENGTH=520 /DNA_ID=CAMNT_0025027295 /DNA_START=18 /DNA_END=1576 /DNA_ORIENTATION=-